MQLQGLLAAFGAFFLWGIFPLYFKLMGHIPPVELMAHRIIWSLVFVLILLAVTRRFSALREVMRNKRLLLIFTGSALLIGINWLTFVWSVSEDRVLEAGLGYFINPLVSVVLGMIFFGERLNKWQGLAVGLAVLAVVSLTIQVGSLPWVSLILAFSFGFYGLLRKLANAESAVGLTIETAILFPISVIYIVYLMQTGTTLGGAGGENYYDMTSLLLLLGTGLVTAIPLILFSIGATRLKLSTVGLLQYIAPSMHVVLAVFVFEEPFQRAQFIGFGLIWIGLLIYSWDGFRNRKRG